MTATFKQIMKKKILFLMGIFSISIIYAQVGINTKIPQAALDIKALGNTSATKSLSVKNDANIEIFSIRDDGRVLTSKVTSPSVLLDLRDNSSNSIFAVGESDQAASVAKAGALKYNDLSKSLYLSDDVAWNELASDFIKAFVVADLSVASQSFNNNTTSIIANWTKLADSSNSFNPLTGVFTAKRSSVYSVSLNITLDNGAVNAKSQLQALLTASGGQQIKCITTFNVAGTLPSGVQCNGNFNLALNETLSTSLWHNLGIAKKVKIGYNNLTIVEL